MEVLYMMGRNEVSQNKLEFIVLNDFVPSNHILRLISEKIDFTFIYEKMEKFYSNLGRRSIDPVLMFKMLLIGYLFNIRSERELEEQVHLNIAYRWFLGLDLSDQVPDHSTFSQNRRRRFKDSNVIQDIFDHVVKLCIQEGLIGGEIVLTDSTHIKASASGGKVEKIIVEKQPSEYLDTLEEEVKKLKKELEQQRKSEGKKKRGKKPGLENEKIEVKLPTTDPDSGLLNRPGKPKGPHYLAHTSFDSKHGIIVDIHPTAGNLNDSEPYVDRLKVIKDKFNLQYEGAAADKGYDTTSILHGLKTLNIESYISPIKRSNASTSTSLKEFTYDKNQDLFICPFKKELPFSHFYMMRNTYYKTYSAKTKDCKVCPLREECFGKTATRRTISRPIAHDLIEENYERSKTEKYKEVQRLRRIWCEGSFGTMKGRHNLFSTYKRGTEKIKEQCLFSALALNLKRMIKVIN
jgi:transposase